MTCWVAASAGVPAAAALCAAEDAAWVGEVAAVGRVRPPVDRRDTAKAMIATSASARTMVRTRPPARMPLFLRDGLTVSNSDALLGSINQAPRILDQVRATSSERVARDTWPTRSS